MLIDFSKEEFDIIVQAGQSNSEGCGLGDAATPFVPNYNTWFLNSDYSLYMEQKGKSPLSPAHDCYITIAQEKVVGNCIIGDFSLSFSAEYINNGRLDTGRKLLIIRSAVGGTGFSDSRWGASDDLFLRMLDMIRTAITLNPQNRLVAFLWHQGETDAMFNVDKDTHYKNLKKLIEIVRNTFECNELPFIAADFVNQWKTDNMVICKPVVEAIREVCSTIGNAGFVETAELQSNDQRLGNEDTIHFCREAIDQLGVKYFKAFMELRP